MPEPRFGKALALQRQGRLHPAADTLQALIDTASSNSPIIDQSKKLLAAIESEIREQGGPTNPELLQEKHPAAVWHLLDALNALKISKLRAWLRSPLRSPASARVDSTAPAPRRNTGSPPTPRNPSRPPADVPHVCRIQTHRSRSGYRHGFERTLALSAWVV